jgi:hypothetical protein
VLLSTQINSSSPILIHILFDLRPTIGVCPSLQLVLQLKLKKLDLGQFQAIDSIPSFLPEEGMASCARSPCLASEIRGIVQELF